MGNLNEQIVELCTATVCQWGPESFNAKSALI